MEGASEQRVEGARRRPARFAPTKFTAPVAPAAVLARPALVGRLEQAPPGSLRVVVGSPGAGKTTLLTSWVAARAAPAAWLSLDAADVDPVRFWQAAIAAVRAVAPGFGDEAFDLLTLDGRVDQDALESLLIDADALDRPVVLVVDDFHHASREVADQLALLLDRGLRGVEVAIGSRRDVGGALGRLRVAGRIVEVREVDLRLAPSEVAELVPLLAGSVALTPDEIALLQRQTEGWAVGVCLAIATMEVDGDVRFLDRLAGSNQALAPYLSAELLDAQPPEVRQFLLDTCIVDELSPDLAAELCPGSDVTLAEIEARHLLLVRVDPAGDAFRYHHLFAELLRYRLHAEDPGREVDLHLRAAAWFERRNPVAAFRHAWRAGHRGVALDLVDGSVLAEYFAGRQHSVREVAATLTDADLVEAGGRAAAVALALALEGAVTEGVAFGARLARVVGTGLASRDHVRVLTARGVAAMAIGDVEASRAFADEALSVADREHVEGDWADLALAMAIRARALTGVVDRLDALAARVPSSTAPVVQVDQWSAVGLARLAQARFPAADDAARTALAVVDRQPEAAPDVLVVPLTVLGSALLEQDHPAPAEPYLRRALELTTPLRRPAEVSALVAIARLRQAEGSFDAALAGLDRAADLLRDAPAGGRLAVVVAARRARVLAAMGRLDDAHDLLASLPPGLERTVAEVHVAADGGPWRDLPASTLGGDGAEAASLADVDVELARLRGAALAGAAARGGSVVEVGAAARTGDAGEVPTASEVAAIADRALALVEATGALFAALEAGTEVIDALRRAARRRPQTSLLDRLARARPHVVRAERPTGPAPADALSERERTVLRYLATALSYREIADELYVSINTVKTHVKNVIRKLGVGSRHEAVDRARELGYL